MAAQSPDSGHTAAAAAAPSLSVELDVPRVEMDPGGPARDVVATVHNLSNITEQYTIHVSDLDSDWFTASVTSVSLFPGGSQRVQISLHPPKRPGIRPGSYTFRVTARAIRLPAESTCEGVLDLRVIGSFRIIDLVPRRTTARGKGRFRLQVANTGPADLRLGLEGRDPENACTFGFPNHAELLVPAEKRAEHPVVVKPKKRPWVGRERSYEFTITAKPIDARAEPLSISGQFTHKPLFETLPVWPVLKWCVIGLVIVGVLVTVTSTGLLRQVVTSFQIVKDEGCSRFDLYDVPVLGGVCPARPPQAACVFADGFKAFVASESARALVGTCTTNAQGDGHGNVTQTTTNGMLIWVGGKSNTIYFLTDERLYVNDQGQPRPLDSSGRPG